MKKIFITFLFIIIFSLPRVLQEEKIIILIILLLTSLSKSYLKKSFLILSGIYISIYIIPFLIGLIYNNNPKYILNALRINILFPILLFYILQQFNLDKLMFILKNAAIISLIFIFVLTLSTVLYGLQIFPINLNQLFYKNENAFRLGEGGYVHIINSSLTYLIFIVPLYFYDNELDFKLKSFKSYFFIIFFFMSFISGRRILVLPFLLVSILKLKKFLLPLIFILILFTSYFTFEFLDKGVILDRFTEAINEEGTASIKNDQSVLFVEYINKKPFFGYGLGSYMKDLIRNEEDETAYEKRFHYMFFSLGIPITLLCFSFYAFLIYKIKVNTTFFDTNFKYAIIISFFSIFIASNTNPYWLSTFDYTLPLALMLRFSQNE
jgi:hypothetical protein